MNNSKFHKSTTFILFNTLLILLYPISYSLSEQKINDFKKTMSSDKYSVNWSENEDGLEVYKLKGGVKSSKQFNFIKWPRTSNLISKFQKDLNLGSYKSDYHSSCGDIFAFRNEDVEGFHFYTIWNVKKKKKYIIGGISHLNQHLGLSSFPFDFVGQDGQRRQ